MEANGKKEKHAAREMSAAIQLACGQRFGVLDSDFLCRTVASLEPRAPICVREGMATSQVLALLRTHRIGCVLVCDAAGVLRGIFTERDCVLKVLDVPDGQALPIDRFMTASPVAEPPDIPIAYALNLMSSGGFRHLPLVDPQGVPVGIISVKDVLDRLVDLLLADLGQFGEEAGG